MKFCETKKEAFELLDMMKDAYKEMNINVEYDKDANLEELNAIIELNFKKFAEYAKKTKGISYDRGGIQ
tara:strand:- start:247 stop:453 length:207 start_codon:yes stop_codon:yes gene_type:complete